MMKERLLFLHLYVRLDLERTAIPEVLAFDRLFDGRRILDGLEKAAMLLAIDVLEDDGHIIWALEYGFTQFERTLGIGVQGVIVIPVILVIDDTRSIRVVVMQPDGHADALDGLTLLILDRSHGFEVRMGLSIHSQHMIVKNFLLATRGETQQSQYSGRQVFPKTIDDSCHLLFVLVHSEN